MLKIKSSTEHKLQSRTAQGQRFAAQCCKPQGQSFAESNLQARGAKFLSETVARFFMDKDKALLHHIHRSKALNNLYV